MEIHLNMERAFFEKLAFLKTDFHDILRGILNFLEVIWLLIVIIKVVICGLYQVWINCRACPKIFHHNFLLFQVYDHIYFCLLHPKVVINEVEVEQILREFILQSEPKRFHVHLYIHHTEVIW